MRDERTPPLLPPGRDELETRLMGLREVTSTIPLATPARVRARGEARRRHQATAVVTGCALAAAAVVFAVGGLPGGPQAVAPPATQAPSPSASPSAGPSPSPSASPTASPTPTATVTTTTVTTATSAAAATPDGDASLIVPPNAIDGVYFLSGDAWTDLGLGQGRAVRWHEAFDWEGGLAVHAACDVEGDAGTRPPGVSTRSQAGILNLAAEHSIGWQRVRILDDAGSARTYLSAARQNLTGCPNVTKEQSDGYAILTVTRHAEVDHPNGDPKLVVYRARTEYADDSDPFVEWIVMGYTRTPDGRHVVTVLSTGQDVKGDVMRSLGLAALERIDSVSVS